MLVLHLLILHPLLLCDVYQGLWVCAHTRGAKNRGSGEVAGPDGGRCFRTRELARRGRAQVWYIISEASPSPVLLGGGSWTWHGRDGLAPWASTASQYTAPNSLKKHCSLSVSATGKPGSDQLPPFFGVLYAYRYEYGYIVRMCVNVVVFFYTLWKVCLVLLWSFFFMFLRFRFFLLYFSLHL